MIKDEIYDSCNRPLTWKNS